MDIYDWIATPENRDYLRDGYTPSLEEKMQLICGGLRPWREKQDALVHLLSEADTQEEKETLRALLWMYNWAFKELREDRSEQVFIAIECRDRTFDDVICSRAECVDQIFHTYDELLTYISEFGAMYNDGFGRVKVEKWIKVDGKMKEAMSLCIYADYGRAFISRFDIPWERRRKLNLCFKAEIIYTGDFRTTLPLPFQHGDLVRIDIPVLNNPIYGVVQIYDALGRYVHLAYIEDNCLKCLDMSYQDYEMFSGWRVIDWTHPVQVSELPPGHELLAELTEYMHRADLDHETRERISKVFYCRKKYLFKTQLALMELLEEVEV